MEGGAGTGEEGGGGANFLPTTYWLSAFPDMDARFSSAEAFSWPNLSLMIIGSEFVYFVVLRCVHNFQNKPSMRNKHASLAYVFVQIHFILLIGG